jgi:hypothetical protein
MSFLTAEQVIAANKANVEILFGLTNKAFEGVEKLVELNLQVAKTALSEAADTTKAAMSVKDAQELPTAATCTTSLPRPTPKSARSPKRPPPTRRRSSLPSLTRPSRTPRPAPRTPSRW